MHLYLLSKGALGSLMFPVDSARHSICLPHQHISGLVVPQANIPYDLGVPSFLRPEGAATYLDYL